MFPSTPLNSINMESRNIGTDLRNVQKKKAETSYPIIIAHPTK
jgi:hypothetical protein